MEANKEKKHLTFGSHLYKFVPGDIVDVKLHFPHYTMLKVEVYEYDINDKYELKPVTNG